LQLVNFSVTNYRSITSAHKIAISNITALIGKNNEGKSNVLRSLQVAMSLLKDHGSTSQTRQIRTFLQEDQPYDWKRDFPIQLQARKGITQTIFKLEFFAECG
jgi:AAA15 family ATPase/GTPase